MVQKSSAPTGSASSTTKPSPPKRGFLRLSAEFLLPIALLIGLFFFLKFLGTAIVPPLKVPAVIPDPNPNAPVTCGGEVMRPNDICGTFYDNSNRPIDKATYEEVKSYQIQARINQARLDYQKKVDDQKSNAVWTITGCLSLSAGFLAFLLFIVYLGSLWYLFKTRKKKQVTCSQAVACPYR